MTRTPEVRLDDDGAHILFSHECAGEWIADERLPHHDSRGWTVESADPLTVSPSLHCLMCGTHGFWRSGAWVSA